MPVNPAPQQTQQQARKVFDPIPVPYSQLLPYLVHSGMVTPKGSETHDSTIPGL
ncbi:hypothetical protein A2U01_0061662, partial [Trifolium medium]|nr:hypothetical protein [Trifolium medium]